MPTPKPRKAGERKSEIVRQVPQACADETAAAEFLESCRWGDKPRCPHCRSSNVYTMKNIKTGKRNKDLRWRCRACKSLYTVRTDSVMADSRIPLRYWVFAFWAACSSKKGVSAKQIQRQTGLSYKSALFLLHRIRWAMANDSGQLTGTVEADETYVGGRPRVRRKYGEGEDRRGHKNPEKSIVAAVVQRGGEVRVRVLPTVTSATLGAFLTDYVKPGTDIMTDGHGAYRTPAPKIGRHQVVRHHIQEYVSPDDPNVHTNTVEGFFSLIKRGIYGVYHNVSPEHLHRYVSEFAFRYNTRKLDDGARMRAALRSDNGKLSLEEYAYRAPA